VNLPPDVQGLVDKLRASLGVPPCQIVLDMDRDGVVQAVEPRVIFRRVKPKDVDSKRATSV
jgi:hypothetical protein